MSTMCILGPSRGSVERRIDWSEEVTGGGGTPIITMTTLFQSLCADATIRSADAILDHVCTFEPPYVLVSDWPTWFSVRNKLQTSNAVKFFVVNGDAENNWTVFKDFVHVLNLPQYASTSYDTLGDCLYDGIWSEGFLSDYFLIVIEGADVMLENELDDLDDPSGGSILVAMFEETSAYLKAPFTFENGAIRSGRAVHFLLVRSHR